MQVGQAILDRKLGQGGMAEVWLGHNAVLQTPVAVKFLIAPWAGHPELEQRFLNEARRQGALDHPNIVKVYGFEYVEDHSFLIMQYIDGESLDEKLAGAGRRPLDFGEIRKIAAGALTGLEYAHKHQVVHRDVKPSNIMIDSASNVYISDFGLALIRDEQRVTGAGHVLGTPLYMSPEQILHPRDLDHRCDIYSFGCVLYEMFSGRAPFEAGEENSDFNVKLAHTSMEPVPLRQINSEVPPEVERVVMKCLEKNPDDRFMTCSELSEALAASMAPASPRGQAPVTAPTREDFQKLFEEPASTTTQILPPPTSVPSRFPAPPAATSPQAPAAIAAWPPPPPRRASPLVIVGIVTAAIVLLGSLSTATYYITRHYFAATPQPEQESRSRPQLQDGQHPGTGDRMPQPLPKVGPFENSRNVPGGGPANPPQPQPQIEATPQQPASLELEAQPLDNIAFRVRLRSRLSSESSEQGQTITASVFAPRSCAGCTMIGVVKKAGRSGFFPGLRKSELLFNFHTLRFPDGQMRAVECRITGFTNSQALRDVDEENQKVDAAHAAKKIFITAAAGTVIGAITRRSKEGAAQGTLAGAQVGVMLTGFTAKGKTMSFAPGSVFDLNVSDRVDVSR